MTARLAAALALALVAQPALALSDDAQQRGGSSGSSASAGAQHHSSSGSSQSSGGSQASGSSSSSSGESQPQLTDAQRRHPRAGTGTGSRGGRVVYGSPYYRSYYGYPGFYSYYPYDSFYSGFGYYPYGYGYYGGYGYGGYGAYGYGYRRYRETGSIRLQVDPPETRVYVDGYYAGVVDDFDGLFQRLHVSPGRHEIALKLDGYRTHKFKAYVAEDHTLKVHYDMAKGTGEDPEDVVGDPATVERRAREARDEGRGRYGYRDVDTRHDRDDDVDADDDGSESGRLVVDVRPGDASIYVDGEFRGTGGDRISLKLSPGRHRIEVVRPGFRTAEREVDVRAGKTTDLNLELEHS